MPRKASRLLVPVAFLAFLSCSDPGKETWPAVQDAVATMLVELEEAVDGQGRRPVFAATWETGGMDGDSIPAELLSSIRSETGLPLYSDTLGDEKETAGILTVFEPHLLAPDTVRIIATWVFPEADGSWHGLEYDFLYNCSSVGCRRHRYFLSRILN